jgi:hypothetical protein
MHQRMILKLISLDLTTNFKVLWHDKTGILCMWFNSTKFPIVSELNK